MNRTFVAAAIASASLVAIAAVRPASGEDEPAAPQPKTRTFRFTYAFTVPAQAGAKRLDAWAPLPQREALQKVSDLEVEATLDGKPIAHEVGRESVYGNSMLHVGADEPKGDLKVSWTAKVTRTEDLGQAAGEVLERFRQADHLVPVTGKAAELAKEIGADKAADAAMERGRRVYDHVLATMTYDKEAPGWGKGDFARACEVGKGNCTDFHAKFTGVARAAGIPVRFTMGVPLGTEAKGKAGGYHCWAHFHDGKTWIPVDISEAQKVLAKDKAKADWFFGHVDADRVSLSVGRDVDLVPRQKGPALLFFGYPYVEVDGAELKTLTKEHRSFAWEDE